MAGESADQTVIVLGAFALILNLFSSVCAVLLVHLSLLKKRARKLVTWIYLHRGYTSLEAMRRHFAKSGMGISHEQIVRVIESVAKDDNKDWNEEPTYLTNNDAVNQKNLLRRLEELTKEQQTNAKAREVEEQYRELAVLTRAEQRCMVQNGRLVCHQPEGGITQDTPSF